MKQIESIVSEPPYSSPCLREWHADRPQGAIQGDIIPDSPGAEEDDAASSAICPTSLGTALSAADLEAIIYKVQKLECVSLCSQRPLTARLHMMKNATIRAK